ncbi:MAG: hypothetical protein JW775_07155 [Candidatus Aminicenantes bacterium]|nr:hypothetical protein [Candidatus Aminicenantes bacterium]
MDGASGQSGYYREIARAFLERRGGPYILSPRDQAAIAAWEAGRVPLGVVLEGIGRTFDKLKARGRGTKGLSLAFCDREVEAAFAQHKDRAAGRRGTATSGARPSKGDRARREIGQALEALAGDRSGIGRLLVQALEAWSSPQPDAAALERIDAEIEERLWLTASEADRAEVEAQAPGRPAGPKTGGGADTTVRRRVVMAVRARRRIPHVAPHFY